MNLDRETPIPKSRRLYFKKFGEGPQTGFEEDKNPDRTFLANLRKKQEEKRKREEEKVQKSQNL